MSSKKHSWATCMSIIVYLKLINLLYLLYMIDKNRSPPPGAFILDEYEQQIKNDVAKGLYVPISKEEFFLKLQS